MRLTSRFSVPLGDLTLPGRRSGCRSLFKVVQHGGAADTWRCPPCMRGGLAALSWYLPVKYKGQEGVNSCIYDVTLILYFYNPAGTLTLVIDNTRRGPLILKALLSATLIAPFRS